MSEVFSFSAGGTETIAAFNVRIGQFCADNPVVAVQVSMRGDEILLSLMEDHDTPFPIPNAVQPFVKLVEPEGSLENIVTNEHMQIRTAVIKRVRSGGGQMDFDDVSILQTTFHSLYSEPNRGFLVSILNLYDIPQQGDD